MARRHPKKCPVLRFETDRSSIDGYIEARAVDRSGTVRGRFYAQERTVPDTYRVSMVRVDPKLRGCGVGTQLYLLLARTACKLGRPLASDVTRTHAAEMFWRKQVAKDRARCVGKQGRRAVYRELPGDDGGTFSFKDQRRWLCTYYVLDCPAPTSLARPR